MNKPVTYWRKTYPVGAVRLTTENMLEVAADVGFTYNPENEPHIKILGSMGFAGDWVVQLGESLYVIESHEIFMRRYHTHDEQISNDERYARVHQLVTSAMVKQGKATFEGETDGMDLVAIDVTKRIMKEL